MLNRMAAAVYTRASGVRIFDNACFEAGGVVVLMGVPDSLAAGENRLLKG
jgi:hypothetical protein